MTRAFFSDEPLLFTGAAGATLAVTDWRTVGFFGVLFFVFGVVLRATAAIYNLNNNFTDMSETGVV